MSAITTPRDEDLPPPQLPAKAAKVIAQNERPTQAAVLRLQRSTTLTSMSVWQDRARVVLPRSARSASRSSGNSPTSLKRQEACAALGAVRHLPERAPRPPRPGPQPAHPRSAWRRGAAQRPRDLFASMSFTPAPRADRATARHPRRRLFLAPVVALLGDRREYRLEYGLVSASCSLLQFVAVSNCARCSTFQLAAVCCSGCARTLNPKVGGSSPPRPTRTNRPARGLLSASSASPQPWRPRCPQAYSKGGER